MEDAVIVAVSGEVWIRDTAGNMRMARVGDRIEEGSVLVTGPTGLARLDFGESEEPLVVGADHQLSVPFGQGDGDSPPSGEVLPEERLDLLLKVLEPGASERSDLQPLAGSAAVDGEANEGYGFVRLLRILEKVSPLDFPFDVSPIDEVQPRSGSVDPRDGGLAPDERIDDDFSRSGSDENQAALAPTVLLDEDGLPRGTAGGPGDAPGTDVVAGGVLGYDEGMREAAVDGALHWLTDGLPVITSQGQALVWSVSDGGLTLSGVDAYGAPLLSVTVTDPLKGEYEARLYQRLDHPDRSTEDDIVLTLGYEVTSRDGDAAQGSLVLIVDDDMPTLIIEGPRGAEEDGSLRGTWVQDGGGDEQSEILVTLSGGDTRYSLDTPIDTGGGLLLVESDNSWTFVPDASAEDGGTPPGFDITITDGDGDTATASYVPTASGDSPAKIDSGGVVPVVLGHGNGEGRAGKGVSEVDHGTSTSFDAGMVDETVASGRDLQGAEHPERSGSRSTANQSVGLGAGGAASDGGVQWNLEGLPKVTSHDSPVEFMVGPGGHTVMGNDAEGQRVLTINLLDTVTGDTVVYVSQDIDQPEGQQHLLLPLAYSYIDTDGSTANGTLEVVIDDDTPAVAGGAVISDSEAAEATGSSRVPWVSAHDALEWDLAESASSVNAPVLVAVPDAQECYLDLRELLADIDDLKGGDKVLAIADGDDTVVHVRLDGGLLHDGSNADVQVTLPGVSMEGSSDDFLIRLLESSQSDLE